jgi:hypothetical protein
LNFVNIGAIVRDMERELKFQPQPIEKVRAEARVGLKRLRQSLIDQGVDIKHRNPDPDLLQRVKGNLSFVIHAVTPIVSDEFRADRIYVNFNSRITRRSDRIIYAEDRKGSKCEVMFPGTTGGIMWVWRQPFYGPIFDPGDPDVPITLDNIEDIWENSPEHRPAIKKFGNLSREKILRKFEAKIR